jgi:hypothetical protein
MSDVSEVQVMQNHNASWTRVMQNSNSDCIFQVSILYSFYDNEGPGPIKKEHN